MSTRQPMHILYIASGIPVPGTLGGSVHAYEVARGLARRGHRVDLVAAQHTGWGGLAPLVRPISLPPSTGTDSDGFRLHWLNLPKPLALAGAGVLLRLARSLKPDVIMERYYNFAGGGVWAAHRLGLPCLLEVNALMVDPPVLPKRWLDEALGRPMRRWAVTQCNWSRCIVTPLHTTVPPEVPRSKIVELPWGADVSRFGPPAPVHSTAPPTVVFLGSFRAWHGVLDVVRAGIALLQAGQRVRVLLIGDGPERPRAERLAAGWGAAFQFTGAIPYAQVPAYLRTATVGVAPFTTAPHPALRSAGFFWSPLKVYEYMAASLPVVTTDLPPLRQIIREGQEGALFPEASLPGLVAALQRLLADPQHARTLGQRARARVVAHYSWQRHCADLEGLLSGVQ